MKKKNEKNKKNECNERVLQVKAYFSQFGRVEEAVMLMDQQTKRHRGFGFVTFESEEVVDRICEIHYHTIKNKKVECKKAQPKEAILASTTTALLAAKRSVLLNGLGVGVAHMPPGAQLSQLGAQAGLGAAQQFVAAQAAQVINSLFISLSFYRSLSTAFFLSL